MNKILADAISFGRQYLRSKVGAFFTFIFPILLVLLFGAVFTQTGSSSMNLPVQDRDGTPMSQAFLSALNNTTVVKVAMIPADVNIQEYVRANSLSVALEIPDGFEVEVFASLASNGTTHANVTLYGDPSQSSFGLAMGVVSAVADQMSFGIAGASPLIVPMQSPVVSERFGAMDYLLPGIIGMTVMFNTLYIMAAICAEYRTRKYFKLLATTTLTKSEWLAAKILWFTLSMILSLVATLVVGILAWNVQIRFDLLTIAFIVAGSVLFASLGMIIGSFAKDSESASALSNAIGFPMMFLAGTFWQLELMPEYLQAIAKVMPLYYLSDGLRDTLVYGNLNAALLNLGVVSGLAVVLYAVGAKVMSWKER